MSLWILDKDEQSMRLKLIHISLTFSVRETFKPDKPSTSVKAVWLEPLQSTLKKE